MFNSDIWLMLAPLQDKGFNIRVTLTLMFQGHRRVKCTGSLLMFKGYLWRL